MKAVALLSGGLDSTLAIRVILDQGIEVIAIHFLTPFGSTNRKGSPKPSARRVMDGMGVELKEIRLTTDYFEMLKNPKHGYGKNTNPCIDCHILMCREAKKLVDEIGAKFVITGEVLGQRPMSQHRTALRTVEKESGLEGLLLRPLSARLLPHTIPEKEGWVNREKLHAFSGRTRKPQMVLAGAYRIENYPAPAGGCLLTCVEFGKKVKDILDHSDINVNVVELLKVGRHFRLSPQAKIVVGRNKEENERIQELAQTGDVLFDPVEVMGPTALARGEMNEGTIALASRIAARYCDGDDTQYNISHYKTPNGEINHLSIEPTSKEELDDLRI